MTSYSSRSADEWRAGRPAGNGQERDLIGDLQIIATENLWDRYGPAVARHEQAFGRPAPHPVVDAPTTQAGVALSAEFVEWMMGYPQGWVTDLIDWRTPAGRRAALRLLGNSVVPACATAAYSELLGRLLESEAA